MSCPPTKPAIAVITPNILIGLVDTSDAADEL